jgi:hypothetical protein
VTEPSEVLSAIEAGDAERPMTLMHSHLGGACAALAESWRPTRREMHVSGVLTRSMPAHVHLVEASAGMPSGDAELVDT